MGQKWTETQRKRFIKTMKAKRNGAAGKTQSALPPTLEKALYDHYRRRVIADLVKGKT